MLSLYKPFIFCKNNVKKVYNNYKNEDIMFTLPKTKNQKIFTSILQSKNIPIIFAIGPAGTGKTLLSCSYAINGFINGDFEKIIITRPAVMLDEEHGFIPGTLEDKLYPWLLPIYDNFEYYMSKQEIKSYINNGSIQICPFSHMRGRTFHNACIVADEVQNTTCNQMKTLLTRIGNNSKLILTGDLQQSDITKGINGLQDFVNKYNLLYKQNNDDNSIQLVHFNESDILRCEIIKDILKIYEM